MLRRAPIFVAACLLIAAGIYWNWDGITTTVDHPGSAPRPDAGSTMPTAKVITQAVTLTGNDRVFEAIGTGRARLSVQIYPAVAGEVTEVLFSAQQRVEKGDVLLQLDDRQQKLAVRLAEVELKEAQNLLARYEQAVKDGAVPQSEVESARADVDGAQVALDRARLDLDDRRIRAPFSGIVGIPSVDPGDRVGTDTLITGLDDRDILHVDFEIPEALTGALQGPGPGTREIIATTPAHPGRVFSGSISAQESRVDPDRRTLKVRANIENEDDLLRPGMSFKTRWEVSGPAYPTVPEISLQWGRDGSFVWVVRDGIAERISARVIARTSGRVLVESDIAGDEQVVVEGLPRLRPGAPVEILGTEGS